MRTSKVRDWFLLGLALLLAGLWLFQTLETNQTAVQRNKQSQNSRVSADQFRFVTWADLPSQAQLVYQKIRQQQRLPYPQDGSIFNNYQAELPTHPRGYYREYTVPTPGESDRGARRIVTGNAGEIYYTADHYQSFVRVKNE